MKRAFLWLVPHPFVTLLLAVVWILFAKRSLGWHGRFRDHPRDRHLSGNVDLVAQYAQKFSVRQNGDIQCHGNLGHSCGKHPSGMDRFDRPKRKTETRMDRGAARATPTRSDHGSCGNDHADPGTVSADLSDEGHSLLVHVLHTDDPDAVRDDIVNRYQSRLKEIFV